MKKLFKVLLFLVALAILISVGGVFYLSRGLEEGRTLEILAVDPAALSDGTYTGTHTAGRWSNEVAVTIHEGKITAIKAVKDVRVPIQEVTDEIFSRVIEAQNTTVDAVSEATVTSKAYLKSIENALTK